MPTGTVHTFTHQESGFQVEIEDGPNINFGLRLKNHLGELMYANTSKLSRTIDWLHPTNQQKDLVVAAVDLYSCDRTVFGQWVWLPAPP